MSNLGPTWLSEALAGARRKVFVSFHHADQRYRDEWDRLTNTMFINKSVHPGDIDTELGAEYVGRLIRQDYISDASVVVVLVGPKTYCRKHVDWEIAAALDPRSGGRAGLVSFLLPHHPNFGPFKSWDRSIIPARLADNLESGYAFIFDWTNNQEALRTLVDQAFHNRIVRAEHARNGRLQMPSNTCE